MSSVKTSEFAADNSSEVNIALMMLRKPTDLKKVIESVPKPVSAVPKNGLPMWFRLGLESKLPMPKMPLGKVVFSRGKIGEDVRRLGLGSDAPHPTFDLSDPNCYTVSYDYVPMHDPHLAHHFAQKPARNRMKQLGFCTKDGRAVCSLKEFNQYRKYLYNRFMDRIHMEMKKLDERARDDLTLKRVEADVARRQQAFTKAERAREHLERIAQEHADEWAEKRRLWQTSKRPPESAKMAKRLLPIDIRNFRCVTYPYTTEEETHIKRIFPLPMHLLHRQIHFPFASTPYKKRAKEQEKKIKKRMKYLAEFNEKQRKERAARAHEKQNRIKQRVQAAAELELRRKITMVRQWRTNERQRLFRLKQEREAKTKRLEDEANRKWADRINAQNSKIQEETLLLKIYTEDMKAGAMRRAKKAEVYAYNTDLELQRIRLANWKLLHGGDVKAAKLVKKMGVEFEKSKRGAKGMSPELAQSLAIEAMTSAVSTQGDPLVTLGQARTMMDVATVLPSPPLKLLEEVIESVVMEFTRQRVHVMLRGVENLVHTKAANIFFSNIRPSGKKQFVPKKPRWAVQVAAQMATVQTAGHRHTSLDFGNVETISNDFEAEVEMKSIKDRPPTPVPSKTKLAEVTFLDRLEDLPNPVSVPSFLPERRKILEMINIGAKLLTRSVSQKVTKGMDVTLGKVTLPRLRQAMEWGEAVEGMTEAVVDNRVHVDAVEVRHTSEYLASRVLRTLNAEMKEEKKKISTQSEGDFYVPEKVKQN